MKESKIIPINPIINNASDLILLIIKIKNSHECGDITELHLSLINSLKLYLESLINLDFSHKAAYQAQYCLCTTIDEVILNSYWGSKSNWSKNTLLNTLYSESDGGEKFYDILESLIKKPKNNLYAIELIYTLLNIGFKGKLIYSEENEHKILREKLYTLISKNKEVKNQSPKTHIKNKQTKHSAIKIIIIYSGILLLLINILSYKASKILSSNLKRINPYSPRLIFDQITQDEASGEKI